MKRLLKTIAPAAACLAATCPLTDTLADPSAEQLEFFESKVRPLMAQYCFRCHSDEADSKGKLKAGLKLDSLAGHLRGGDSPAITPGEPDKSLLIEAVGYLNEDMAMPPKAKLSAAQISVLIEWVQMGAPWPGAAVDTALAASASTGQEPYDWEKFRREHWSFRPIAQPGVPTSDNNSPIDAFVLTKLKLAGLEPNPRARRHILIRRAYLDLIGLPPTPEQLRAFLEDDSEDAFEKVVDELLASEHYGERWARHWLDVARYSDGHGGFGDSKALPAAWRYRDWVVDALNADMPFDQFAARQIAGDLLERDPDPVATGFFVVGPTYQSDGGDPEAKAQAEAETLSDRVDTFSRAFLGLTAACARCHHHKFDPITTDDYYAIAGIFRNTRNSEHPLVPQAEVDAYNSAQQAIGEQDKRIKQFLDAAAKHHGVERKQVEKSLVEEEQQAIAEMRAELDRLKESAPPKYATAQVLQDSGSSDMHIALRGDLRKKGEKVPRRFVQIIAGETPPHFTRGSGRLELARAVVAPDNPLTARVIVNRVWGWHFGRGLVRTPSNFGVLGDPPTHPELLDWLAADFIGHGWSLKRLHLQILLSATWQMSSQFDAGKFRQDADNQLLWRMNPRRLEAEVWRDSLLAVTGELDRSVGGPPVGEILQSKRRTLYATISRTGDRFESDGFLRLFDFPAAVATSAKRVTSTVPQQYLFMMNSQFMSGRAQVLGSSFHSRDGSQADRIRDLYLQLYSREPAEAEITLGQEWLGATPSAELWHQYAQTLLSAHELIQIR